MAIEVTTRPDCLHHYLKFTSRSFQKGTPEILTGFTLCADGRAFTDRMTLLKKTADVTTLQKLDLYRTVLNQFRMRDRSFIVDNA